MKIVKIEEVKIHILRDLMNFKEIFVENANHDGIKSD